MWQFLSDIRELSVRFKIDRVIFAHEGGGSKYRLGMYPDYKKDRKAQREKATEAEKKSLAAFFKAYQMLLDNAPKFGIKTVNVEGAEADDVIAFLINNINLSKWQVMLLSSDTDLHQLLRSGVCQGTYGKELTQGIYNGRIPSSLFTTVDMYREVHGISPTDYAFAKSLSGDTSDSIKGFTLVGPKISLELIKKYKSFKNIQDNLDTLTVPRLSKTAVAHMKEDFSIAHRNYDLINLNWSREKYEEILGVDGVEKLITFISEIPTPEFVDRDTISELCYEYGRIDIVESLDFWLHAFCRRS